jgi:hypothetical protein
MSRKGECVDQAVAARVFGSLKRDRMDRRHEATRHDARADVGDDLEMGYTSQR